MVADVEALRDLGVAGVVVGCLTADGAIDEARMRTLVEAAGPLAVTCHRAFDMTRDAAEALEALIRAGVGRVLTSGQRDTAMEGIELLAALGEAGSRPHHRPRLRRAGRRQYRDCARPRPASPKCILQRSRMCRAACDSATRMSAWAAATPTANTATP